MRVPRSRGAISGTLLVLLGVWGAIIPFVGPYYGYAYTPDKPWDYTTGRLVFQVLPGVGAVLGGLLVLGSANRAAASLGGWLAALSGAWFVVGVPVSAIWAGPAIGEPIGDTTHQFLDYIGFFGGLGVAIVFLSAFALGRFAVVGVREAEQAAEAVTTEVRAASEPPEPEHEWEPVGLGRFRWS
jgi:hypothetical protein